MIVGLFLYEKQECRQYTFLFYFFYTNSMINCNEVIKTRFFSLKWVFYLLFVDNLLFKNNPIIFFTSILENL